MDRWGEQLIDPRRVPGYLGTIAGGLAVVMGVETTKHLLTVGPLAAMTAETVPWAFVVSILISVPFVTGIGYGAWYLSSEPVPVSRNRRIFGWCVVGGTVWLAINLLTMVSFGIRSVWAIVGFVRGALAWGTAFGLAIGVVEARSITRAIAAEQARLRSKHLREQRNLIDYVNSLIRHEVLNSVTVIHGRAQMLETQLSNSSVDHVEPILRRSEEIETVVKEVGTIMESVHDEPELEPRSLRELLSHEVPKVHDVAGNATVQLDVPEVSVLADDTIRLVFGNLLTNAVEHADDPQITVSATVGDETVSVRVTDDGPGVDPAVRDSLFERPDGGTGDHGFGLALAAYLCERCGGEIELTETGPEGTTFTVRLPLATDEPASHRPDAVPIDP